MAPRKYIKQSFSPNVVKEFLGNAQNTFHSISAFAFVDRSHRFLFRKSINKNPYLKRKKLNYMGTQKVNYKIGVPLDHGFEMKDDFTLSLAFRYVESDESY